MDHPQNDTLFKRVYFGGFRKNLPVSKYLAIDNYYKIFDKICVE